MNGLARSIRARSTDAATALRAASSAQARLNVVTSISDSRRNSSSRNMITTAFRPSGLWQKSHLRSRDVHYVACKGSISSLSSRDSGWSRCRFTFAQAGDAAIEVVYSLPARRPSPQSHLPHSPFSVVASYGAARVGLTDRPCRHRRAVNAKASTFRAAVSNSSTRVHNAR